MKATPALFNGDMVRALLDDLKGQTRRQMKPQPEYRENKSLLGRMGTFFHGWNIFHFAVNIGDIINYSPLGEAGVNDMLIINHGDKEIQVRVIDESGDYVILNREENYDH